MPDNQEKVHFTLLRDDRDFLLEHFDGWNQELELRLRFGVTQGNALSFSFSVSHMVAFLEFLHDNILSCKPAVRKRLFRILDSLEDSFSSEIHPFFSENLDDIGREDMPEDGMGLDPEFMEFMDALNPIYASELARRFPELMGYITGSAPPPDSHPLNMEEISPQVVVKGNEFMTKPHDEYGGLSLHELGALLNLSWFYCDSSPLKLTELSPEDLGDSPMYQEWFSFMQAVCAGENIALTKDGFIDIGKASPALLAFGDTETARWLRELLTHESILKGVLDFFTIMGLEIGILRRRKGCLTVPKNKRGMLMEKVSGFMFREFFCFFFQSEKIGEFICRPATIENAGSYALYALDKQGEAWMAVPKLIKSMMLPGMLEQLAQEDIEAEEYIEECFRAFVFDPLVLMGLLQSRQNAKSRSYRNAPNMKRFVSFDFSLFNDLRP